MNEGFKIGADLTIAVHICYKYVLSAGHSNTIILIDDLRVSDDQIRARANIKAIAIVSCWETAGCRVGSTSVRIIQIDVVDCGIRATCNLEAVDWPVLDIEIVYDGVGS